jgi:hypothetical protein
LFVFSIDIYAGVGITLARLFTFAGVGRSIFSFSPSSLGAGLSLIFLPDADSFILACSKAVLDALRFMLGVDEVAAGLTDDERDNAAVGLVFGGVGVPRELRLGFRGGGPMEPIADLAVKEPFVRVLLDKGFIALIGVSIPRVLSLLVSESAEGGLTIPGVVNVDNEPRRSGVFDG